MKDQFLPTSYEVPNKPGNYMKFADGENRFRVLASPILGWEASTGARVVSKKPILRCGGTTVDG